MTQLWAMRYRSAMALGCMRSARKGRRWGWRGRRWGSLSCHSLCMWKNHYSECPLAWFMEASKTRHLRCADYLVAESTYFIECAHVGVVKWNITVYEDEIVLGDSGECNSFQSGHDLHAGPQKIWLGAASRAFYSHFHVERLLTPTPTLRPTSLPPSIQPSPPPTTTTYDPTICADRNPVCGNELCSNFVVQSLMCELSWSILCDDENAAFGPDILIKDICQDTCGLCDIKTTTSPTPQPSITDSVNVVLQVQGLTEENSRPICDSVAKAVGGSVRYCSLQPKSSRRYLQDSSSLFLELAVSDADSALNQMQSENFISTLEDLPTEIIISNVNIPNDTNLIAEPTNQVDDDELDSMIHVYFGGVVLFLVLFCCVPILALKRVFDFVYLCACMDFTEYYCNWLPCTTCPKWSKLRFSQSGSLGRFSLLHSSCMLSRLWLYNPIS